MPKRNVILTRQAIPPIEQPLQEVTSMRASRRKYGMGSGFCRSASLALLTIAMVFFCPRHPARAADLAFTYAVIDANPPSGSSCCLDVCGIGDFDGDGTADVFVGSENSIGVVWYHAPTWTRYVIGDGSFTTDGEAADVDGDGDTDVVISCISRSQIEWWENLGNPFQTSGWTRHKIGDNFAHDVAVGDIDNDGNVDVTVFLKGSEVVWFEAPDDPRGNWTRRQVASSSGEGLDVGDIDGDGDFDIAGSRNWYENSNGAGTSWSAHTIVGSWGVDCRDVIADMDADGDNDVVLSHSEGSGPIAWFENPGWTRHTIDADNISYVHSLNVADFDIDGDLDVFAGQMHLSTEKRIMVYTNLGGGASWSRKVLATTGTHNACAGDVDADGLADIVGKNFDGQKKVEVWINSTFAPVAFAAVTAHEEDGDVVLEWAVSESEDLAGFDIFRAEGDASPTRINTTELPASAALYRDGAVDPGRTYTYYIVAYDHDGPSRSRAVTVTVPVVALLLDANYPNPFSSGTTISFRLPAAAQVRLTVHDVTGRLVAVLADGGRGDGTHEIEWNGRDHTGATVPSGVYFCRLEADGRIRSQHMLLLR